jgi:hypothetical protein
MTEVFGESRMQNKDIDLICNCLPLLGGRYIEIGSFCGASASRVLERLIDCHVVCIDNLKPGEGNPDIDEQDYLNLMRNYKARRSRMNVWLGTSTDFLNHTASGKKLFDLSVVDGSHDFQSCYQDLCNSSKLVKIQGKIIVHDYCSDREDLKEVRQATDKFCEEKLWRVSFTRGLSAVLERTYSE